MVHEDFNRPPRAEAPPLEVWLEQVDRAETSRAPFFAGRDREFDAFFRGLRLLERVNVGGDTLIFQGAPGAGKTGFMRECMEAVRQHSTSAEPWVAVEIMPGTVINAADTVREISDAVDRERDRPKQRAPGADAVGAGAEGWFRKMRREVGELGGGVAGLRIGAASHEERAAARHFKDAAPRWRGVRIAVFIDEAQNMPGEQSAMAVLDCLHRGVEGIDLLTVFLGLSDTADRLGECGISRPGAERLFDFGPLEEPEAQESIRATFDAYAIGEEGPARERWIKAIAESSQGWPQHMSRVAVAAAREAKRHDLDLGAASLSAALAAGEAAKAEYYQQRLGRAMPWPELYKSLALAATLEDGAYRLSKGRIEALSAATLSKHGLSLEKFLQESLHAGVLAPADPSRISYRIPIPSFVRYLRELPVEAAAT